MFLSISLMPLPLPLLEDIGSVAELYDAIETVLGSQVGEYSYTIKGIAQTSPAIFVVENRDTDPPREWERTGIEVLIYQPTVQGHSYLGGTGLDWNYEIKVIQHDRSSNLINAKSTLLCGLPMFQERSHLGSNAQDQEELNLFQVQTHIG
jgi:hypothetical protein